MHDYIRDMISKSTFATFAIITRIIANDSLPAIYPPTPPLLDGATAPDVVNIMFQAAGLLKDTEILASVIGVVSHAL